MLARRRVVLYGTAALVTTDNGAGSLFLPGNNVPP
jgi:hypothetical protein